MPIDICTIVNVYPVPTMAEGVTRFQVVSANRIYTTIHDWQAALCERASRKYFPVRIVWRDTRFGPEMVECEALEQRP